MKKQLFLLLVSSLLLSCSKPFPYKFDKEPQVIDCPNANNALLNEALYSFKDDIQRFFLIEVQEKDYLNFQFSYAQYIYRGAANMLYYNEIASPHTLLVFKELEKQEGLLRELKGKSNLNYDHEWVECLIGKIKSDELRKQINYLLDVNYLSPEVMAETYRSSINPAETDPNFLLFIALDTFYQRFMQLDVPQTNN